MRQGWQQRRLDAVVALAQAELEVGDSAVSMALLTDLMVEPRVASGVEDMSRRMRMG